MRVLIIKRYEREFRIPFYKLVNEKLQSEKIFLDLHYGDPNNEEKKSIKDYIKDERIGKKTKNTYINILGVDLCYQSCLHLIKDADLIIVQQGNRELLNYVLLLRSIFLKKTKIAFWGHGKNFQGNPKSLTEGFKKWYSNKVDFWFAYNDLSKKLLIDRGFNENKIASLNNTIDTAPQIKYFDEIDENDKATLRSIYKIESKDPVGIFCASIYKDKQIDFLLMALSIIKSKVPALKFFVIGKGVEDFKVIDYSKKNEDWFFYVGNKFNEEKIKFFSIADFQAIPGAVGLNIIDSFAFLCPLITTKIDNHGPEISYLINNENGIITEFNIEEYAHKIIELISDINMKNNLKEGCKKARKMYTIETMATNFVNGVLKVFNQ